MIGLRQERKLTINGRRMSKDVAALIKKLFLAMPPHTYTSSTKLIWTPQTPLYLYSLRDVLDIWNSDTALGKELRDTSYWMTPSQIDVMYKFADGVYDSTDRLIYQLQNLPLMSQQVVWEVKEACKKYVRN
jgi:hypothetical protein